jgi:hypothetical protein
MDHPTLSSIVSFIQPDEATHPSEAQNVHTGEGTVASQVAVSVSSDACQLPGGAYNPEAFSAMCFAGCDASVEVPLALWDVEEFYDPAGKNAGTLYTKHGGFIEGVE